MRLGAHLMAALTAVLAWRTGAGELPRNCLRADEIKRGMKGYGLTVFQGTRIDRFDVEVIGVLKNAFPKQNMILCRMSGAGLGKTGIVSGMSGSPIYLKVGDEAKLAGAIAYGWTFPKEPVCGVTPVENMHAVIGAPVPERKAAAAPPGKGGELDAPIALGDHTVKTVRLAAGPPTWDTLVGHGAALYRLRTPLFVGGMTPQVFELARQELEPMGFIPVQGGAVANAKEYRGLKLEPGSALAMRMAEGDIEMDGVGTCTAVFGDTVLAFGHPMFGEGRVSVPMATAVVHLSFPSLYRSFKLASSVETVGRLTTDMLAGIVGKVGESARMIPVEAKLRRADMQGEESYRARIFDHPRMTSRLVGYFLVNCLMVRGDFPRENTLSFKATIELEGHEPLVVENAYSGLSSSSALMKAVGDVYSPIALLANNPFGDVKVNRVAAAFEVAAEESMAGIESIRLERNDYEAGETVRVLATLRTYKKEPVHQWLELKLPDDLPAGSVSITVCDASTSQQLDKADAPHRYAPRSVDDLLRTLREPVLNRRLFVRMRLPDRGVAVRGVELPSLPASMLSVIQSPKLAGLTPTHKSIKASVETPFVVSGTQSLPIVIRPRETP